MTPPGVKGRSLARAVSSLICLQRVLTEASIKRKKFGFPFIKMIKNKLVPSVFRPVVDVHLHCPTL